MLNFFADPFPDETLLSSILRYCHYTGTPYKDAVMVLLGSRPTFPFNLYSFVHNFPPNTSHSVDSLLLNNTCFPVYTPLLHKYTTQRLLKAVNGIVPPYRKTSIVESNFIYCPLCAKRDISLYGEPYYHREHQIYGVHICYRHKCILKRYSIDKPGDLRIAKLNEQDIDYNPQYINNKHDYNLFSTVAYTMYYLLVHDFRYLSRETIESIIFHTFTDKGYTSHDYIKNSLFHDFIHYCGQNVLSVVLTDAYKLDNESFIGQYLLIDTWNYFNIVFDILLISFLYGDPTRFLNSKELEQHCQNPTPPSAVCCRMI